MRLSVEDRLKLLVPARLYYRHKIAKEVQRCEPELAVLADIVRAGSTTIDVGANRGVYSYAMSAIAGQIEAFEPIPALARFAAWKLGRRARVHRIALSNREGRAALHIPYSENGEPLHLLANLPGSHGARSIAQIEVELRTLDSFGFTNVGFIKIDVEGAEMDVIEGAAHTIARDRPNLLVELLNHIHRDPLAEIEWVERKFDYQSWVIIGKHRIDARHALNQRRDEVISGNVLFTPKPANS